MLGEDDLNTLYAFISVLSLAVAGVSLLSILGRRLRRRAALALGASVVAFFVSISLFTPDQPANATQVETTTPKAETLARPDMPALPVKDEPPPRPVDGSPGIARICLADKDVHLKAQDEIIIPATTVFEDDGPNLGKPEDPSTWHYEVKEGFQFPAQLLTLTAVSLQKSKPCAEAKVQMLTGVGGTETTKRALDKHIFVIDDVLDYPIPTARPPVEIGKLIDDISVEAMLTTDVTQSVVRPKPDLFNDEVNAAKCLAGAKKLAAYLGGGTGQQRSMNIEIGHVGAATTVTYGCPFGPKQKPDFAVYWEGKARPPSDIAALIAKGGEFVTGATRAEIMTETSACVTDALKSSAAELADREVRGVKIECQAFTRDGGGGSVTIYRRFGADPAHPEISDNAAAAADQVSRELKIEGDRKAVEALRFAEWYQDPTIPQNVKVFSMMAARVLSLQQRCPSSKPHEDQIAKWAADAGVKWSDIAPGGRYASLMTKMLAEMQSGTTKESIAEACEAIKKYD
ncbi:hypothetical protein [Rhizobium jaguaris]|uniref:hypothetical protein n=1 Tax=Rhizobium jaguaris TaxID=1312183 RepID=UPI0013C49C5F|nr:hypothetical protein [Rhizobium jaguaris]